MKKIVFYLGSLCTGGAERVIVNLSEFLAKEGWNVTIVTKLRDTEEYVHSDNITRIIADITEEEITDSRAKNLYLRLKKLRKIWKEINPDLIVSFIVKNNFMAITSAIVLKIPVLVSVRSAPAREYNKKSMALLVNPLFARSQGVILQTQDAVSYFSKRVQKKAIILPNPLNPAFLRKPYEGVRENRILTVGRMDKNKNQSMLLEAFAQIADLHPEMILEFYGDGDTRNGLELRTQELGLTERVIFHGTQYDIPEKIEKARIFVLPSKVEGMPNALMEAMALGMAVISTDCPCGGPRTLIQQGENGILIPVDDEDALVLALLQILQNKEYEEKLGKNASKLLEELSPEVVNAKWQQYFLKKCK